ncbi:MAG: HD domain-containing protein, partial [Actinomycetota bacterium]|nr:HD domain-containing protein [Actinomycetota bacterium]
MSTVDRVLPWRRNTEQNLASHLSPVVESYRKHHPKASTGMIHRAYDVAAEAHATQLRSSGESYIHHPLAVAKIVAEFGLDDISLSAALLHDAVEDTELSLDDLRRDFGEDVAAIVDGVTKLDRLHFDSREAQQAA